MKDLLLPRELYAEVAPLSLPAAEHLYRHFKRAKFDDTDFLEELAEKREAIFLNMDSFVRNRDTSTSPHHLTFSPEWIRIEFGLYSPNKRPVPSNTYNDWLKAGWIRHLSKGQPAPDWVAALGILRMCIQGTQLIAGIIPDDEPSWWCYVQESRIGPIRQIPIPEIPELPPNAFVWTRWPGAVWDQNHAWYYLGSHIGAARFARAYMEHGHLQYQVTLDDLMQWIPNVFQRWIVRFIGLYVPGRFEKAFIQALAHIIIVYLAQERMSL